VTPQEVRHGDCGVTAHGDMGYITLTDNHANHPIPVHAGTHTREDGRPCE